MQLTDESVQQLPELAQAFLAAFRLRFAGIGTRPERIEAATCASAVPAAAAAVGPIDVVVDAAETTVVPGAHTHSHFSPWTYLDQPVPANEAVTGATLTFLAE